MVSKLDLRSASLIESIGEYLSDRDRNRYVVAVLLEAVLDLGEILDTEGSDSIGDVISRSDNEADAIEGILRDFGLYLGAFADFDLKVELSEKLKRREG